jgi:hypothetical protein
MTVDNWLASSPARRRTVVAVAAVRRAWDRSGEAAGSISWGASPVSSQRPGIARQSGSGAFLVCVAWWRWWWVFPSRRLCPAGPSPALQAGAPYLPNDLAGRVVVWLPSVRVGWAAVGACPECRGFGAEPRTARSEIASPPSASSTARSTATRPDRGRHPSAVTTPTPRSSPPTDQLRRPDPQAVVRRRGGPRHAHPR